MKKISLFTLMVLFATLLNAQCGKFNWLNVENGDLVKLPELVRDDSRNDTLSIGNSFYFTLVSQMNQIGHIGLQEFYIQKINSKSMELESQKAFMKSDPVSFMERTGIDRERESFAGSFNMSDRIVIITTVKPKKLKESYLLARIIGTDLEIEKYIVFDTIDMYQEVDLVRWGDGLLVSYHTMKEMARYKPVTYYFQAFGKDFTPKSAMIEYLPATTKNMSGLKGLIGLYKEGKVIWEAFVKDGTVLASFDLNKGSLEFYNLDIKERLSDFRYKFNMQGDLVCGGFYLVEGGIKDLPDVKGIFLASFKAGSTENLFSCKIPFNPETFDRYSANSVNRSKTFLRHFKLIDFCFDSDGNTVIAGEHIDNGFNNQYVKGEIIAFTINSTCAIINEHHIPKILAEAYRLKTSCGMFSYTGKVCILFRDNPANLEVYDKDQVQKLLERSRGMLVLAKLDNSGKYVKKCLMPQEENLMQNVEYIPNQSNNCDVLLFKTGYNKIGRFLMDEE